MSQYTRNFATIIMTRYIETFTNKTKKYASTLFDVSYNKVNPGRWNIESDIKSIEKKMDMANYDNCFTGVKK